MIKRKLKIVFIIPSLKAGGAERVMSYVAQHIDRTIFNVTLLVIGYKKDCQYEVDNIKVVFLNKPRVLKSIPNLFVFLFKNSPDIAISAIGHLNTVMGLLSIFFPTSKFVAREVNVNSVLKEYSENKPIKCFSLLSLISKKLIDKIVCQSNDMAKDMVLNFKVNPDKIIVINNPITDSFKVKKEDHSLPRVFFKFITIGRLAKQKGHLRILEVLKELDFPFHYTIIGDGPEKENIFDTAKKYGLSNYITHIPYTKNVEEYLAQSDVFLQGSYVEGFPNALLESCAVGTPVIAFQAPGGIDEIITDGLNGFIADSTVDYVNKIKLLTQNYQNWKPSVVRNSIYNKYNSNKILKEYENLFVEILN
ncbi:glycosyltransferase [Arenibacter sp. 6A1]|uniref:glycosyltransferase n=1 Tax=Arenibacter sp. 6A1 TaxID=2720391 RepID=UPI001447A6FB|nr:glycosyltransferase [Arenibacter sp. 6A1]NKI27110.1 glycosyltransferase [Arenibacter sp. 6A1]